MIKLIANLIRNLKGDRVAKKADTKQAAKVAAPTVVVYGVKGTGKSENAEAIAEHFGLSKVVDPHEHKPASPEQHHTTVKNDLDEAGTLALVDEGYTPRVQGLGKKHLLYGVGEVRQLLAAKGHKWKEAESDDHGG